MVRYSVSPPLYSFSNYGGMPVKAEYSHEAVSVMSLRFAGTYRGIGTPAGLEHDLDICNQIWALHRTTSILVHRLLRSYLCTNPCSSRRGEKSS
jgi:hypothetical protein